MSGHLVGILLGVCKDESPTHGSVVPHAVGCNTGPLRPVARKYQVPHTGGSLEVNVRLRREHYLCTRCDTGKLLHTMPSIRKCILGIHCLISFQVSVISCMAKYRQAYRNRHQLSRISGRGSLDDTEKAIEAFGPGGKC